MQVPEDMKGLLSRGLLGLKNEGMVSGHLASLELMLCNTGGAVVHKDEIQSELEKRRVLMMHSLSMYKF